MKTSMLLNVTAVALLGTFLPLVTVSASSANDASLVKSARVTKNQAERIALAKVPDGRIKSAEIEKEKGHLVWSFDIAKPRTKDITEILVDAKTGRIIARQTESPTDQAKEAAADRKKS